MASSPSSVLLLGMGPASAGLIVTLGFGTGGVAAVTGTSGGYEDRARDPYRHTRYPSDEAIRQQRQDLGILPKAEKIIHAVAARQADDLRLDSHQRLEELQRELALADLNLESRYIDAMNLERERLIDAEIGRRLRLEQDNANRILLMLIGSA